MEPLPKIKTRIFVVNEKGLHYTVVLDGNFTDFEIERYVKENLKDVDKYIILYAEYDYDLC